MVARCCAVLGELHATFVDSKPGGGHALPLVALLEAQPLAAQVAQAVALPVALAQLVACGGCWNGEGRHAVWLCRPSGFVVLWRCPTLPQPVGCSTIGAAGLSFQVRNGGWAFPRCYDHHKIGVQHCSPTVVGGVG